MRWAMLVVAVLAGCGAYKVASSPSQARAASFDEDTTSRTEVGCVQVGVDRRGDRAIGPVVRYSVANHCARPVAVDVAWATVIGRTAEGAEIALIPFASESTSATIAPAAVHETTLAYTSSASIGQLCVDVATIANASDAVKATWRCFGNVISVTMR
jgi:hypothetical protein